MKFHRKKSIEKARVQRILIRATNWVGDAVMTLPALEAARENFPEAHITVLAKPWVAPVFENQPVVDRVLVYDKGNTFGAALAEILRVTRLIRKEHYDLAILFQNAFEAALIAFMGRVKERVGYRTDGRGFMLTHGVPRSEQVLRFHQVGYYCAILRAMGWCAEDSDPVLHISNEVREQAIEFLRLNGIETFDSLVGLSPGAVFGSAKRWPPDRFAQIGDWAVERWGSEVLVFGSSGEKAIGDRVCTAMKHAGALNLCGKTSLTVAMGIMSQCAFFVTNDSGLMHVASALGVPTVAVFGSTDHVATGPRGPYARIVRRAVPCAPCLKPECPTDHRCMLNITPDAVWETMEALRREIS